jgi:cytochrome c
LAVVARKETMKFFLSAGLLLSSLCVSHPAWANPELAKSKNCMSCHSATKRSVGPAFKDIAAKYAGQSAAVEQLTQKVLKGGSGSWGAMVMPPMKYANPAVSEADARTLVQWILTIK